MIHDWTTQINIKTWTGKKPSLIEKKKKSERQREKITYHFTDAQRIQSKWSMHAHLTLQIWKLKWNEVERERAREDSQQQQKTIAIMSICLTSGKSVNGIKIMHAKSTNF